MDIVSALVGFLVGTATGAAGQYFADKYTDQRREKQLAKEQARLWRAIEQRFPAVIAEMRSDFSSQENRHVRVFFVKESIPFWALCQSLALSTTRTNIPIFAQRLLYLNNMSLLRTLRRATARCIGCTKS